MKRKLALSVLSACSAFIFVSCGGGDGSSTPQPPPNPTTQTVPLSGVVGTDNQTSGISGQTLQSQQISPISEAFVTVESSAGDKKNITTTEDGKFSIGDLKVNPSGWIKITVEKQGFTKFTKVINYSNVNEIKDLSLQAVVDPIQTKVINVSNQLNLSSQQTGDPNDDFVSIAVVKDTSTGKQEILSGQELKYQLRKNSNLLTVWQLDINKQLLKQNNTQSLVANIKNYDPTKGEDMLRFPAENDTRGNRLITAGFDFVDVKDQSGKTFTLPKTSISQSLKQALPSTYRIGRLIPKDLIKCDEDPKKEGVQIGFYWFDTKDNAWKFLGYATIYDNTPNNTNPVKDIDTIKNSNGNFYAVLTDADLQIDLPLDRYYNFDYVVTFCGGTKKLELTVNTKDDTGNPVSSYVNIYDNNQGYFSGTSNKKIEYLTSNNTNSITFGIYTLNYINFTCNINGTSLSCDKNTLDSKGCTQEGNSITCTIENPYKCSISGTVKDESGNPKANLYVWSNIAKSGFYTTDGSYKLDVKCSEKGFLYLNWVHKGTFNVNNSKDYDETDIDKLDVKYANNPPVVYIYSYDSVKPNSTLNLYSYAYDPDGDSITYEWSDDCGGKFDNKNNPNPVWTAPNENKTCKITLTVSDGKVSSKDEKTITVAENRVPVISYIYSIGNQVKKGGTLNLYSYAYDLDGDSLTYEWSDDCGGKFDNKSSLNPVWTAPNENKTCKITLTVSDGNSSVQRKIDITVGFAPVIEKVNIPTIAKVGDSVSMDVVASDKDGDNLTYEWKVNNVVVCNTSSCQYAINTVGTYNVVVTVKDPDGNTATASGVINAGNKDANLNIKIQSK